MLPQAGMRNMRLSSSMAVPRAKQHDSRQVAQSLDVEGVCCVPAASLLSVPCWREECDKSLTVTESGCMTMSIMLYLHCRFV